MACLIDEEITFDGGVTANTDGVFYPLVNYENYEVNIDGITLPFAYADIENDAAAMVVFSDFYDTESETASYPAFYITNILIGAKYFFEYYPDENDFFTGTIRVSICEKESDNELCPETPIAEQAVKNNPNVAYYFDDNGIFAPLKYDLVHMTQYYEKNNYGASVLIGKPFGFFIDNFNKKLIVAAINDQGLINLQPYDIASLSYEDGKYIVTLSGLPSFSSDNWNGPFLADNSPN